MMKAVERHICRDKLIEMGWSPPGQSPARHPVQLRQAAQQALETLQGGFGNTRNWHQAIEASITALRAALEQPAEWVGLTDEEMRDALRECPHDTIENLRVRWLYAKDFARAIEAKLREKNGGGV